MSISSTNFIRVARKSNYTRGTRADSRPGWNVNERWKYKRGLGRRGGQVVIVVVSRIGKLRGGALPMRMENQHWMRWHGIVGVVPSVCLLFTSICFHRGRGRFNAHRDIRTIGLCDPWKWNERGGEKRRGRGKVIIGGPWRYACGVSLRFLINFYPIPLLNIYRAERERRPSPRVRAFTRGYTARSFVSFRGLYLSVCLFIFFHSPPRRVTPPTLEGGEVSLRSRPISGLPRAPFRWLPTGI